MNTKKFFLIQLHLISNMLLVVAMIGAAKNRFGGMKWKLGGYGDNERMTQYFKKNLKIGEDNEFPNDNVNQAIGKINVQPLLSDKRERQSSSENELHKNDKQDVDESRQTTKLYPLKGLDYGMRRIDRKRRENRL